MVAFFSAVFGALAGALLQWFLNYAYNRKREDADLYRRILKTQQSVILRLNSLINIYEGMLSKYRKMPNRDNEIPLFNIGNDTTDNDNYINDFLLTERETELMMKLDLCSWRYQSTVEGVKVRNNLLEKYLENSQTVGGNVETGFDIIARPQDMAYLKQSTDELYRQFDEALKTHREVINDIHVWAQRIFPEKTFLAFDETRKPNY